MVEPRIQKHFFDSADLHYACAEVLSKPLADAAGALVGSITAGGKLMACGNARSADLARWLAAEFLGQFERGRPALAAVALSTECSAPIASNRDAHFQPDFARQIQALGQAGDVLMLISARGDDDNLVAAIEAAHAKDMTVVALTGASAEPLRTRLTEADVHIGIPHDRASRIHEIHLLAIHCLCDAVDLQLLGEQDIS